MSFECFLIGASWLFSAKSEKTRKCAKINLLEEEEKYR